MTPSVWYLLVAIALIAPHLDHKFAYKAAWCCVVFSTVFYILEGLLA